MPRARDRQQVESAITPVELRHALIALAGGDRGVRMDSAGPNAALAEAFNRIASTLALLEQVDSPLAGAHAPVPAAHAAGQDAARYVAVLAVDAFSAPFIELDLRNLPEAIQAISQRAHAALEHVILGRITRSTLEFHFHAKDADTAGLQLSAFAAALEAPIALEDGEAAFKVTIGYAQWTSPDPGLFRVMANAEYALSKARAAHLKVATFTDRDRAEAQDRKALLHDLANALDNGELSMRYQPKLNLRTNRIEGAEALLRWRHPTLGWVPPDNFIWLAERSGEIERITRFTIERSIAEQATLLACDRPLSIHINISGKLISDESFVDWAIAAVAAAPGRIGFEITETAVISNPEQALRHMRRIADAGIDIAIDDYGAGLSSLVYLKQFPAKELKIDRAFICELTASHRDPLIVRSTIDLAHALEMEVTAEGVEDEMTLALLRVMGCDQIQGFHLAKPMIMIDFIQFIGEFEQRPEKTESNPFARRLKSN